MAIFRSSNDFSSEAHFIEGADIVSKDDVRVKVDDAVYGGGEMVGDVDAGVVEGLI